ncbi:MAG TPA: type II toxin-antitoxin system prevent-host-death family antitoxin [Chloroflexota bacterium]
MAMRVNMHSAKSDLSALVARAEQGEEVIIMRAGKPVARLVAIRGERTPGLARGEVRLSADFDAPLPEEVLDSFEGR